MTNRTLYLIVKDQTPLVLYASDTVKHACELMTKRRVGTALVVDIDRRLIGIFTGRDAVRLLARNKDAGGVRLGKAMTPNPSTTSPDDRALVALQKMEAGGFRHLPVVENDRIWGVVSRGDFKGMEIEKLRWSERGKLSEKNRPLQEILDDQRAAVLAGTDTVATACKAMSKRAIGSVAIADKRDRLVGIFTGRDAVRAVAAHPDPAKLPLSKAMSKKPVALDATAHAIDALRAMCDGGFRHLPVTQDGRVIGVIARSDFTGVELDQIETEEHLYECLR